jgi:hypothetical protein
MSERPLRNPIVYAGLVAIAAWLGVHARLYGELFPGPIAEYAPQTLWPMVVFATLGLIFRSAASWQMASATYLITAVFDFSLLCHEPWIETLRGTALGALALGTDFLNTDLACYAVGVLVGYLMELLTIN